MSGLRAEEPGSSPPIRGLDRASPSPPGGRGSPAARVACARVWTDEWCVLACVRDWECARLDENACRERERRRRKKDTNTTTEEKQIEKNAKERNSAFLKEGQIYESLKGRTLEMTKVDIVITMIFFVLLS